MYRYEGRAAYYDVRSSIDAGSYDQYINEAGTHSGSYRSRAARARARRSQKVNTIYSLIAAVLVITVLVVSMLMFSITSRADSRGAIEYKYYTSEMVTADHSVEDIVNEKADSAHYPDRETYMRELCSINHLKENENGSVYVGPGNYVVVPYYSSVRK